MAAAPAVPYHSLLRPGVPDTEVPEELVPAHEASRPLCRICARTLPRGDLPIEGKPPFSRILIATDGSALGTEAVNLGVSLARLAVAPVVFLHAAMPWKGGTWLARILAAADVTVDPDCAAFAERSLDYARALAMNASVRFETRLAFDPHPDRAIRDAVRETGCDLVVMGSRSGRLARRVGAHVSVPLLTCRDAKPERAPTGAA
ncbi:MAG TPA: universal stress protein [Luteibacter sp.]|uniref:universal stress protein n=1 Tax=Luteibacter sp. TaxID=1886636 RepID=UPI002CF97DE2|nr:universal stress protein [Luteibacter sp.]HVI55970.1 universal stress protein [Luteibacter sp.]